ncbi:DUF1295 domain-containing protein, partial [candidate division KSB1 bacterium]|nr:DUF1295 domain-containing protein [candidate division KSB1 bacterium]
MQTRTSHAVLLILLALIFTIGLTFASLELPLLADQHLREKVDFLDVATGSGGLSEYKTELYLQQYHLRTIGYICLALIVILIVAGFITGKAGWPSAGAILLFLPAFGHFAMAMFFLGGLGFLRLIWLPALDVSYDLMRLGDIIFLPYRALLNLSDYFGVSIWRQLPYAFVGLGLLLFMLGTLAWFYARMQKKGVADFWVYRISRHPQYLGWIIWSYGILFLPAPNIKKMFSLSNSLPWLLATLVIIAVAMLEEIKMKRERGQAYESYRRRTPFLLPLPRFLSRLFALPLRLVFKKKVPERKREIAFIIVFYGVLLLGASAFYADFFPSKAKEDRPAELRVRELATLINETTHFGVMRRAAASLARLGEPAVQPMIELLKSPNPRIRWY